MHAFNITLCSASGAWWDGKLVVDQHTLQLTTTLPGDPLRTPSLFSIPMASIMFFAKLNPDELLSSPSLLIEFEEEEGGGSGASPLCGGSCVEPGRIRIAPRNDDPPTSTTTPTVDAMWAACCAMSTALDSQDTALEEDDGTFNKHKRPRE